MLSLGDSVPIARDSVDLYPTLTYSFRPSCCFSSSFDFLLLSSLFGLFTIFLSAAPRLPRNVEEVDEYWFLDLPAMFARICFLLSLHDVVSMRTECLPSGRDAVRIVEGRCLNSILTSHLCLFLYLTYCIDMLSHQLCILPCLTYVLGRNIK